jgi:hypothetical protein
MTAKVKGSILLYLLRLVLVLELPRLKKEGGLTISSFDNVEKH